MSRKLIPSLLLVIGLVAALFGSMLPVHAQSPGDFSLEVTPSPVVETIKPGVTSSFDLQIHNKGVATENLTIAARQFSIDSKTGEVRLADTTPAEAAQWTTFSATKFSISPGQWYTQHVKIALPQNAGFSYSFAIVISRDSVQKINGAGSAVEGSIADFTLVNVDKPGATRKLDISAVSTDQQVYEFLPATINVTFHNAGNTIIAPAGNVFIQRGSNDTKPLAALDVNQSKGYVLPGTERTYTASWSDGFPAFKTTTADDGSNSTNLFFNWNNLTHFRFGKYTAKVVAVYNDGQRDVPIEGEVTFWVVPYKTIAAIIILLIVILLIRSRLVKRRTEKAVKKALATRETKEKSA